MLWLVLGGALAAAPLPADAPLALGAPRASAGQVTVDIKELERRRPTVGLGVTTMVIGVLGTLVGSGFFFLGTADAIMGGSFSLVASVNLFVLGVWWLATAGTERRLIDAELYRLRSELTNILTEVRKSERLNQAPEPVML